MKCACSLCPVLTLAGLAALGLGGFNMVKTGCPLGHCSSHDAIVTPAAAVTTVADVKHDCCEPEGAATADCPLCPEHQAELTLTAQPSEQDCHGTGKCPFANSENKSLADSAECPATKVADKGTPESPKN